MMQYSYEIGSQAQTSGAQQNQSYSLPQHAQTQSRVYSTPNTYNYTSPSISNGQPSATNSNEYYQSSAPVQGGSTNYYQGKPSYNQGGGGGGGSGYSRKKRKKKK